MISVQGHPIDDRDLTWRFSRSSGPGGQHVNTSDTQVHLTLDLTACRGLPAPLRARLVEQLGATITISCQEHRSQLRNRHAALERMAARLEAALETVAPRRATRPTRGSQRRRVESKKRRSETKRLRGRVQE